jgi:DMSO/TMAO reductase YedYZ molybdopterin-dependent catalytic subunit
VGFVSATTAAAIVAGLAARAVNAANSAVNIARESVKLPVAATPAPPVPAGADLGIDGVVPLFTPNRDFYRIDTALTIPTVDTSTWRLRIIGDVENEVEVSFEELLALPLIETAVTIACVSNEIGGGLIGNASWLGYPIRELLAKAKPKSGADMVLSRSVDGFTAGTPIEYLQDPDLNALFAVGMNGEPLPLEHGFPVRMIVPGLFGYVSATKWVTELKVTRFADETAYWTDRGWSAEGPVKIGSRIDVAKYGSGQLLVAGVAWAQHTGISAVEVRIDGKEWVPAELATAISIDTWVQWSVSVPVATGQHSVEVRAIDADGKVQSGEPKDVVPDGAEGWHKIEVELG